MCQPGPFSLAKSQIFVLALVYIYIILLGDKTPAKEHAAVWVPDSEAQFCMHCLKAKFTTMNRRVNIHNIVFAQLLHAHRQC